jgi:hypothetical protein
MSVLTMGIHEMDKGSQSFCFCLMMALIDKLSRLRAHIPFYLTVCFFDDAAVVYSVCVSMLNRQLFEQLIELVRLVSSFIHGPNKLS